jgi:hypothetical protein
MSLDTDLIRRLTILEQRLDSLIFPEVSRWQDWTPTVDQNGAVAATVDAARYIAVFNVIHIIAKLTITGTGTAGNDIIVGSVPINIGNVTGNYIIGSGMILDTGTTRYTCSVEVATVTTLKFIGYNNSGRIGTTPSFALANGDVISFTCTYERA